jgi:hypothetical protein
MHAYWRDCGRLDGLAAGLLPGRQHIDPLVLKPLLPNIWLLDVLREAEGGRPYFRHRLIGTKVVEMRGGQNASGELLDDNTPSRIQPNPALARLRHVVEAAEPSWRRGAPHNLAVADIRTVENLFLPLAADGKQVDMVLCYSLFFGLDGGEL